MLFKKRSKNRNKGGGGEESGWGEGSKLHVNINNLIVFSK